ncbi:hypothetical protein AAVH_23993 [Aphelenchoides avenae]|nr:hypothetical protein AAVH_23993 [Aphelenchus avenae]
MAYVSRRDRCCFCHVKVGVEVLGWVGVGFNTVAFIGSLCHHSTSSSVGALLGVLLFVGLIVARRIDNHRWYLPFLILNGFIVQTGFTALRKLN